VEVLRWYDMSALAALCDRQLTGRQTSVMQYGLMLTVKYSMLHAANLTRFCRQSQTSCQVPSARVSLSAFIRLAVSALHLTSVRRGPQNSIFARCWSSHFCRPDACPDTKSTLDSIIALRVPPVLSASDLPSCGPDLLANRRFNSRFRGAPGLAGSHSCCVFHVFWKRWLRMSDVGFCEPDVFPVTQPTVSKH